MTALNAPGHTLYMASSDLDYVSQYPIDDSGFLHPAIQLPMPNGPPQDFVTDRPGIFAYATVSRGIEAFFVNRSAGTLDEVPGSPFPVTGAYLYMIDRWRAGSSDTSTAVDSFAIDPAGTGQLSPLGTHYQTASHNSYASLAVVP